jgi:hypothetical protein
MMDTKHDIVALLAADLASPRVVLEIDKALEANQRQRAELLDLRKMAVRRHGETSASSEPAAPAKAEGEAPQKGASQAFDGTVAGLIARYKTDPDSTYQQLRYRTKQGYDSLLRRIERDMGSEVVGDIDARQLKRVHESWAETGRIAMAHALVNMLRTLATYGASFLQSKECRELKLTLSEMRFQMPQPRGERLTAEHAVAIRKKAHERGLPEAALAQAFQFDIGLRQKDVIGEWVPENEPGESNVHHPVYGKWLRGLLWEEIDDDFVLRHVTSKRGMKIEKSLRDAPMVMEELETIYPGFHLNRPLSRDELPRSGPVIVYGMDEKPFQTHQFRRIWRKIADQAGIPKTVFNMDTRPKTGVGGGEDMDEDDTDISADLEQR